MTKVRSKERIAAKSRPTLNMVSKSVASSSTAQSSSASNRQVILKAPCQSLSLVRSSRWFLSTCLLGVPKILLTCTSVTATVDVRDQPFTRPSHVGGSAWFLSCAFWICLQVAECVLDLSPSGGFNSRHRGCSFNVTSILTSGLIGGRESKEGRQTIFFTLFNPFGDNPHEEEPGDDLSKPRKVHYHSKWKNTQDAVYSVNLACGQGNGLRSWQTRSHAEIENNSVPGHYIHKVISQKGKRTLFERLSTPRPAPKTAVKNAWQS